jgi:transposase-like protein
LNCVCCNGIAKRRGFYRNKNFNVQRFECLKCGTSFSDKQPLDNLRVEFKQACQVLNLLSEGMGIRAVSRLTGIAPANGVECTGAFWKQSRPLSGIHG